MLTVASLRLVSLVVVTYDVTLSYLKKLRPFLVIVLQTIVTTLSAFPDDCLSSVLVNSAAKKYLHFHYGVTPTLRMVSPGAVPLP